MTSNVPDRIGASLHDIHATRRQFEQQARQFSRDAEARQVMQAMEVYDQRIRKSDPGMYERELHELNVRIAQSNLTMAHLLAGVRRAYSGPELPWNAIGAVMTEAKAARQSAGRGRVVREMAALPAAPPSTGPVRAAYGAAAGIDCPECGAPAGDPCRNSRDGGAKRIPCIVRKRATV